MGDSITEGTVSSWIVQEGDRVNADDVVCVLETDKVSIDVRAPCSGIVLAHLAKQDQVVGVGVPLFTIEEGEGIFLDMSKPSKPEAIEVKVESSATPYAKPPTSRTQAKKPDNEKPACNLFEMRSISSLLIAK